MLFPCKKEGGGFNRGGTGKREDTLISVTSREKRKGRRGEEKTSRCVHHGKSATVEKNIIRPQRRKEKKRTRIKQRKGGGAPSFAAIVVKKKEKNGGEGGKRKEIYPMEGMWGRFQSHSGERKRGVPGTGAGVGENG